MFECSQGDIITVDGRRDLFLVVSKDSFIQVMRQFHICPLLRNIPDGPTHINIHGINGTGGTAICESLKLLDPSSHHCTVRDRIPYAEKMDVSDAIQGFFEYE